MQLHDTFWQIHLPLVFIKCWSLIRQFKKQITNSTHSTPGAIFYFHILDLDFYVDILMSTIGPVVNVSCKFCTHLYEIRKHVHYLDILFPHTFKPRIWCNTFALCTSIQLVSFFNRGGQGRKDEDLAKLRSWNQVSPNSTGSTDSTSENLEISEIENPWEQKGAEDVSLGVFSVCMYWERSFQEGMFYEMISFCSANSPTSLFIYC